MAMLRQIKRIYYAWFYSPELGGALGWPAIHSQGAPNRGERLPLLYSWAALDCTLKLGWLC